MWSCTSPSSQTHLRAIADFSDLDVNLYQPPAAHQIQGRRPDPGYLNAEVVRSYLISYHHGSLDEALLGYHVSQKQYTVKAPGSRLLFPALPINEGAA